MTRRLAVPAALLVAVLAGCTSTAPSPSLDLSAVVTEEDAPVGLTWVPSGAELTAGEDLETVEHYWQDSAGEPEACLPLYLAPYGISVDDEGSTDRTVEVGFFGHEALDGSIMVNAREFPTEQAATEFIQSTLEAANTCEGYTIDGSPVAQGGYAVARFTGGHGLSLDGGLVVNGISSRSAVVRAGRTILVVDAFLRNVQEFDPGFDLDVVDEIARAALSRVGA